MVVGAFHIIEAQVVIPHGGSGIVQLDPHISLLTIEADRS